MSDKTRSEPLADAVGSPLHAPVGRLEPERAEDGVLLALAATAAGLRVCSWLQDGYPFVEDSHGKRYGWNPLVFDSDAFRLTVQLGLALVPYTADIAALHNASGRSWAEMRGADTYAAARRAIVRAAADLGAETTPNAQAQAPAEGAQRP